ncbi:FAS1-like dehydratase domain-containing protein [Microbacterium hydrothermale]|uniref:FAS1-like dehydratase domain-containing protein n=1 Tax=Microbacterium hydrothermale TaxID=857427 RepID=UPI0010A8D39E|nr:MaoC family dehydratase N-terminal domain-containing protein [Microbacterium hydrothermale]
MTTSQTQILDAAHAEAYRSTFAAADPMRSAGDELPPGWEGAFFPFAVAFDDLRADGTPARDGILPEIDLPRRMYAGEDTTFPGTLRLGDEVTQTAAAGAVVEKTGASGRLVFADIERTFAVDGEVAVRSTWHDVFLGAPSTPARAPRTDPAVAAGAAWLETVALDARRLFRFSALTFNTHLVHYDRRWAREVEGLPDLLVHGPLLRILLVDAARRHAPGRRIGALRVRLTAPTFVDREIRLCGTADAARVVAVDPDDVAVATAEITFA